MDKYKNSTYHKGYFHGGVKDDIILITCEDKIVIMSKLQSYVLHWYHMYLLHPGIDRTKALIFQHFHWPDIRHYVRRKVTNCETCQCTKRSNKKYGKLEAKLAQEIPRDKLCVDIIVPYVIRKKARKKTYI